MPISESDPPGDAAGPPGRRPPFKHFHISSKDFLRDFSSLGSGIFRISPRPALHVNSGNILASLPVGELWYRGEVKRVRGSPDLGMNRAEASHPRR